MAVYRQKVFDLGGVYDVQDGRVWAVSREDADKQLGIH